MVNQWVEFVRKYAKDNNISYGCAVSEASPSYKKYKNNTNIKNMDKSTKKYKKTLRTESGIRRGCVVRNLYSVLA